MAEPPQAWPEGSAPNIMKERGRHIRTKILDVLKREPSISHAELSKMLGIAESTVRYHLARLRETGLLEK